MRVIASNIGNWGPNEIAAFATLLDEPVNNINLWAAFHLFEVIDAPLEIRKRAFLLLEERSKMDDVMASGIRSRLVELRMHCEENKPRWRPTDRLTSMSKGEEKTK
jgi:hypothetical protein